MPAKKAAKKATKTATKEVVKKAASEKVEPAESVKAKPSIPRKTVKKASVPPKAGPTTDEIAEAAYLNYRQRMENGQAGDHHSDWLRAEEQLTRSDIA